MIRLLRFVLHLLIVLTLMTQIICQELLVNGNFSLNSCLNASCIFTTNNSVQGWIPEPQIEIGNGSTYNSNLGTAKVIQLAGTTSGCIRQTVTGLQPGIYQLKYNYAATSGVVFDNSQFIVKFNTKQLREITPADYKINSDLIEISIFNLTDADIRFCSTGLFDTTQGAVLQSVSFMKSRDLPVVSSVFNSSGFVIGSHDQNVFQNEYEFGNGPVEISFNYRIVSRKLVRQSTFVVKFDGQQISYVCPCLSGKNITIQIPGNVLKGFHNISFSTAGNANQALYKIIISNIVVKQTQCIPLESGDLITNGNFQNNKCTSYDYCIWSTGDVGTNIPNWIPFPQIQIGRCGFYNPAWTACTKAADLDTLGNSCIQQKLILKSGRINIKFDYAPKLGYVLDSNQALVKLNGVQILFLKAANYNPNSTIVNAQVVNPPAESVIEFCAAGISDCYGIAVSNIKLLNYDRCASTQTVLF